MADPPPVLRFLLVLLPGLRGRERHSLPPEVSDAEKTLCGLPRPGGPGAWSQDGFTCRLLQIECWECRRKAAALLPPAHGGPQIFTEKGANADVR